MGGKPEKPPASPSTSGDSSFTTEWITDPTASGLPPKNKTAELLHGFLWINIEGFFSTLFDEPAAAALSSKAWKWMSTNGAWQDDQWVRWPTSLTPDSLFRFLDHVARDIVLSSGQPVRGFRSLQKARRLHPGMRESWPHIAALVRPDRTEVERWDDVLIVGIVKADAADDNAYGSWLDLAGSVQQMQEIVPDRLSVWGFTVCGELMRVFLFDRSGVAASKTVNIRTQGRELVDIFSAFLAFDTVRMGFDPLIQRDSAPVGNFLTTIPARGHKPRQLLRMSDCRSQTTWPPYGRAIRSWLAAEPKSIECRFVVKDVWAQETETDEGALLSFASGHGVKHIPQYYYHYHHEHPVTTTHKIRHGLDVTTGQRWGVNTSHDPGTPGYLRGRILDAGTAVGTGAGTALPPPERVLRRIVISAYGDELSSAYTPEIMLRALRQCILGHRALYELGILHRGVSCANLRLLPNPDPEATRACIIGLDSAIYWNSEDRPYCPGYGWHRYLSRNVALPALWGRKHSCLDDIEAFFWVLLWLTSGAVGPRVISYNDFMKYWDSCKADVFCKHKQEIVSSTEKLVEVLKAFTKSYAKPLVPVLLKFHLLLPSSTTEPSSEYISQMYEKVIAIFDEQIAHLTQDRSRISSASGQNKSHPKKSN